MLLLIRGISHTHTHAWTICASDACGVKIVDGLVSLEIYLFRIVNSYIRDLACF